MTTEPERITSAPSHPMGVARDFLTEMYEREDGLHLRHHRGNFHCFDGACWPEAEDRGLRAAIYRWLEQAVYWKGRADDRQLVPWEPTYRKLNDVLDAVRALTWLSGTMDAPCWIVPQDASASEYVVMDNGMLHVPTRTLRPHTPMYWSHHRLPYAYDADAGQPGRWLTFLRDLWPDDQASIDTLQEIVGYIIAGGTYLQKIIIIVGPKRGGKGTIGRVITGLLGRHNVAAPTMASLATNFGMQELIGRPLALISDARLSSRADSSIVVERLLSVSGEDSLTIDRKYKDPWTGRLPTRFMLLTNEIPQLADASGALASRFVMLVLTRSFYGMENPRLTDELLTEAPAILTWALDGLARLMARGYFEMPQASEDAIIQMGDLASPVGAFVRSQCVQRADAEIGTDELWTAWKGWCADENRYVGTKATFGRDLKATAPNVRRTRPRTERDARHHVYAGIRLATIADRETTMPDCYDHRDQTDQNEGIGPAGHGGHGNLPLKGSHTNGTATCRRCGCTLAPTSTSWLCGGCRPSVVAEAVE